jgi:predicted PurR-regulated permease PerM
MESTGAPNRARTRPNGLTVADPSPTVDNDKSVGGGLVVRLASPSLRGVVRTVLIVTACAIGLYLVWRIRVVVRLVAISLFFALTLLPMVDALERKTRAPRALIILAVYAVLIAAIALIGYVVAPSMVKEVQQLSHDAPRYAVELRHNGTFQHYDDHYHISAKLVQDAQRLPQLLGHLVGPLKDVTVKAFSFIGQLITVLALAFLLVLHGRKYVGMGLSLTGDRQARYRRLIIDINKAVADYMLGNVVISVLATLATWIVLSILGVPYALSLGFLVGFFDLIPLVGATLGAIVVGIATLTVNDVVVYRGVEHHVVCHRSSWGGGGVRQGPLCLCEAARCGWAAALSFEPARSFTKS